MLDNWKVTCTLRKILDHEGLVITFKEVNWGPKLFKVFNV